MQCHWCKKALQPRGIKIKKKLLIFELSSLILRKFLNNCFLNCVIFSLFFSLFFKDLHGTTCMHRLYQYRAKIHRVHVVVLVRVLGLYCTSFPVSSSIWLHPQYKHINLNSKWTSVPNWTLGGFWYLVFREDCVAYDNFLPVTVRFLA
jgi:hypothetical protein